MEADWVIPGPETVVLKGSAVTAPRPHDTRQVLDNVYRRWQAPERPHKCDRAITRQNFLMRR